MPLVAAALLKEAGISRVTDGQPEGWTRLKKNVRAAYKRLVLPYERAKATASRSEAAEGA